MEPRTRRPGSMTTAATEIIPRAQLSAWQRWELAVLHEGGAAASPGARGEGSAVAAAAAATAAADAARQAGYAEGLAAAQAECARLATIAQAARAAMADHAQGVADGILDLAVALAREFLRASLEVRRDAVLPVVRDALGQLGQLHQQATIALNPADLALVRKHLAENGLDRHCEVAADPAVAPGGCRIATPHSEVDATLATRWSRLMTSLGRTDGWLDHAG